MQVQTIGWIVGKVTTGIQKISTKLWPPIRFIVIAGSIILILPPITQYWLSHVRFPEIPISAIIALFAGSLFLLAIAALSYVALHFARTLTEVEHTVTAAKPGARRRQTEATDGSFVASSEVSAWAQEQLNDLKRQGILTETDTVGIETLAEEMGMAAKQRQDRNNGMKRAE